MSKVAVSVIIPVYNRPRKVVRAIQSVLKQSFCDYEIIIVDDGSSPPLALPENLAMNQALSVIRLERNRGAGAARNAGVAVAQGKWLAFLDSDDVWHHDKLAMQMDFLKRQGEGAAKTGLACGYEYAREAGRRDKRIPVSASDPLTFFSGCWFCPGSTIILSYSLFQHIGPFDENLHRLEDLDWFIRLALAGGRIEVVRQNLVTIRTGQKVPYDKVKKAGEQVLAKYAEREHELPSGALANLQAYLHVEYAASALKRERNRLLALGHMLASLRHRPRARLHIEVFWN
jgi:glycosyltransferase involved in cell wall biosynthesis